MRYSYNWLKELVKFNEPPAKLAEILNLRSFEVENIKKSGGDWVLDLAVLPNRIADASGHIGLAREIAAIGLGNLKIKPSGKYSNGVIRKFLDVRVENESDCRRYMALMIKGVKPGESPRWLKDRLELCGIQSINTLVDAANYVMLETGQPLHIFDFDKIENMETRNSKLPSHAKATESTQNPKIKTIIVRRAKQGEKLHGLDEKVYELTTEVLVIADSEKPLAIAGIKGGKDSGVSFGTKTVILESANFNHVLTRNASRQLGLKTDASLRFEHDLDPNICEDAIKRLADLIRKVAGGEPQGFIDVYPKRIFPSKILMRIDRANKLVGEEIPVNFYKNALSGLGMNFEEKGGSELIIEVPTFRRDILSEEDLVEEIARIYGYEKVQPDVSNIPIYAARINEDIFGEDKIRDVLTAAGFTESFIYEFMGDKDITDFSLNKDQCFELENPASEETKYLITRPIIKLLRQAGENSRNFESVGIFSIAKSFSKSAADKKENSVNGVDEKKNLVLAFSKKGGDGEKEFYELKGVLDQMFESLGIADYWYDDEANLQLTTYPSTILGADNLQLYHPYRRAEVKINDRTIGVIGEIHPAILQYIKSKQRIVACEIDFDSFLKFAEEESEYRHVSKFPTVIRDLSIVLPFNVKTESVLNVIENTGGELLVDTDLFDYFQDEEMKGGGQKSLAFHLKFESSDKTLQDIEVDEIIARIIKGLEAKGWKVRK